MIHHGSCQPWTSLLLHPTGKTCRIPCGQHLSFWHARSQGCTHSCFACITRALSGVGFRRSFWTDAALTDTVGGGPHVQLALAARQQWLATAQQHAATIQQDVEGLLQFEFSRYATHALPNQLRPGS